MAESESISVSGIPEIDALLTVDEDDPAIAYRWDTTSLTYSFPDSEFSYVFQQFFDIANATQLAGFAAALLIPGVGPLTAILAFLDDIVIATVALNGFEQFTGQAQASATFAMEQYAAISGLTLTEQDEGLLINHADIRFAETATTQAPAFGIPPLARVELLLGEGVLGDTWYVNDGQFDAPSPGDFADWTILHEAGHALGLKHGHEAGLFGGRIPEQLEEFLTDVSGPILDPAVDSLEFTVMTYRAGPAPDGDLNEDVNPEEFGYPQTLMMLDIRAIQYLYGANFDHNSNDTTYSWDPADGTMSINGLPQRTPGDNRIFMTIWDGNGTDTYDLSAYSTGVNIDLRPGEWILTSTEQLADLDGGDRSSGLARGNVANALLFEGNTRSMIENAIGGSGNDTMLGNNRDNVLIGNAGNDEMDGGDGTDTVSYTNSPSDVVVNLDETSSYNNTSGPSDLEPTFSIGAGQASDGFGFTDDLVNLENIIGSTHNDVLIGNQEDNQIQGLEGNDLVIGNDGDDEMDGGDDVDTVSYRRDPAAVNVNLALGQAIDGFGNTDQLENIENVVGSPFDDTIVGDNKANTLMGQSGDDLLVGGDGSDTVSYGTSQNGVVVNIDESQNYSNNAGDSDVEPTFSINAGKALDGFGFTDTLQDIENIIGSAHDDVLIGNQQDNEIQGLSGDDLVIGNAGDDEMDGSSGFDTVSYRRDPAAVSVNLALQSATDGFGDSDQLKNIEGVIGSAFDDNITGDNAKNLFMGEAGNDFMDGGDNDDTVSYQKSLEGVIVNIDELQNYSNTAGAIDLEPTFTIDAGEASDGFGTTDTLKNLENIIGSVHDDVLIGNQKENQILGLLGDDLVIGNAGNDEMDGGEGTDTVSYRRDPSAVNVDLASQQASDGFGNVDQVTNIENVVGSAFDDIISGDAQANAITAGSGSDTVKGAAGNDQLYGETGDDFLMGEAGDDLIDGGDDNDTVSYENSPAGVVVNLDETQSYENEGGELHESICLDEPIQSSLEPSYTIDAGTALDGFGTTDTLRNLENIIGSESNDVLIGNAQDNRLEGLAGNDLFIGNAGNDVLDGGPGSDGVSYSRDPGPVTINLADQEVIDGFGDTDQLISIENAGGSAFSDEIIGSDEANIIFAGAGDDTVEGRGGNDILFGEEGNDVLLGQDDDDFLVGGLGEDVLDGGAGNDKASYFTAASSVRVSLQQGKDGKGTLGDADGDILPNIENLEGSRYDDTLIGNEEDNILSGLEGNDELDGKAGDDGLYGGPGDDFLNGSIGNDFLSGGDDNDELDGDNGDDTLLGDAGDDYLDGREGDDLLEGGEGNDTLLGRADNDTMYGGAGEDFLDGSSGEDIIAGGDDNDQLFGDSHNDQLFGDGGDDLINGGAGDDLIDGGAGNDILTGDSGSDIFVLALGMGADTITDFVINGSNKDFLGLENNLTYGQLAIVQDNNDTLISFSESSELLAILTGVKATNIASSSVFIPI